MIRICILGEIGSGKSFVAKNFGYPVFNADKEVGELYKKDKKVFNKLKKVLPKFFRSFPIDKKDVTSAILENKSNLKKIITINTNLYESAISTDLEKIQKKFKECSIGSYPFFNYITKVGGVNIVISSWTIENLDEISIEIQSMVSLLGGKSSIV